MSKQTNNTITGIRHAGWLWAGDIELKYKNCERGGKWLIFVSQEIISSIWSVVKDATENGRLGGVSKVS